MQFLTSSMRIQFVDQRHCKLHSLGEYSRGWWIDRLLAWLGGTYKEYVELVELYVGTSL